MQCSSICMVTEAFMQFTVDYCWQTVRARGKRRTKRGRRETARGTSWMQPETLSTQHFRSENKCERQTDLIAVIPALICVLVCMLCKCILFSTVYRTHGYNKHKLSGGILMAIRWEQKCSTFLQFFVGCTERLGEIAFGMCLCVQLPC